MQIRVVSCSKCGNMEDGFMGQRNCSACDSKNISTRFLPQEITVYEDAKAIVIQEMKEQRDLINLILSKNE